MAKAAGWRTTILRWILKLKFTVGGLPDALDGLPRVYGKDLASVLPSLEPGDILLLGNSGELTHAAVHVGDGQIVHSMATEKTMRGWWGALWDTLRRPFRREPHVGVIRESWPAFFDRYERDTWVVLRVRAPDSAARARGVGHVQSLVGKPYDYSFTDGDDSYYCTEIAVEFLRTVLGAAAPELPTTRHAIPFLLSRDLYEPVGLFTLDDLVPVLANRAALRDHAAHLEGARVVDGP